MSLLTESIGSVQCLLTYMSTGTEEGEGTDLGMLKDVGEGCDRHVVLSDTFTVSSARTCHDRCTT